MIFNNYLNFCCFIFLVFLFLNFSSTLHHHRLPFFISSPCITLSSFSPSVIISLSLSSPLHHPFIFHSLLPPSSSPFLYLHPLHRHSLPTLPSLHPCGERGIRTPDTVSRIHTFQACALNHSAISPQ